MRIPANRRLTTVRTGTERLAIPHRPRCGLILLAYAATNFGSHKLPTIGVHCPKPQKCLTADYSDEHGLFNRSAQPKRRGTTKNAKNTKGRYLKQEIRIMIGLRL